MESSNNTHNQTEMREEKRRKRNAASKAWRDNNKEYMKEYRKSTADKMAQTGREWYLKNKSRKRARANENYHNRRANDPIGIRIYGLKASAKKRGLEFTLDRDYLRSIVRPTHCPILGIELDWNAPLVGHHPPQNSVSLDRIDSTKGYIPGNVCWVSYKGNRLKGDGTIEDFQRVIQYMKSVI